MPNLIAKAASVLVQAFAKKRIEFAAVLVHRHDQQDRGPVSKEAKPVSFAIRLFAGL